MARLKESYIKEIRPALMKELGYTNIMQIPRLEKIVLNMGVSEAVTDRKALDAAFKDMKLIAGQQPIKTKARLSVATFKIREGMDLGIKVTLRKEKMFEFMDRLVNIALPRIRDFRGISPKSFDGCGNYSLGVREHIIFPEIDYDKVENVRGLDITIVTTAKTDSDALSLLKAFNMPFKK